MNTKEMTREQISALADGELSAAHVSVAMAALRSPDALANWEIYHQIGDVLRSDDMAVSLSPGFAARMSARLAMEPAILAPAPEPAEAGAGDGVGAFARRSLKRWAIPGAVATMVATVAFFTAPQLMVALTGSGNGSGAPALASAATGQPMPVSAVAATAAGPRPGAVVAATVPDGVVLRDPRIDDYLLAHQRFSPFVFSSTQYARSAAFAADSNK